MSSNKLLRVFLDVNMQLGHDGLTALAQQSNVSVRKLQPMEHVVFVNRAVDKVKIYSSNGVVSYLRSPTGKLDLGTLEHFAECFGAEGFQYTEALRKTLLKKLKPERVEHRPWKRFESRATP